MPINRRNILRGALFALSALVPTGAGAEEHGGLFQSPRAARAIGRRYLAVYPEERDAARLKQAVFAGRLPRTMGLREHVRALCRRDFAVGDTVLVDGWVLSRSEARLCALLALGAVRA